MENIITAPSGLLKWALIISIVIVFNLFLNFSLSLFYKAPQYDTFCKQEQVIHPVTTQEACIAQGGQWDANQGIVKPTPVDGIVTNGYCNLQFTCQKAYDTAYKLYSRNVFIALVIFGVVALGIGLLVSANIVVSTALSFGGALSFIIASMRYWLYAENYLQVLILAIALGALIYLAIRKFK
jgi:hypothetical protein